MQTLIENKSFYVTTLQIRILNGMRSYTPLNPKYDLEKHHREQVQISFLFPTGAADRI